MAVEDIDEFGEVHLRSGQAVDLVDDDDVDPPFADMLEQALDGRPLQRAAGDAAIVVEIRDQTLSEARLRGDEGGAGFALGVERVKTLIKPLLARFAGVDGAAQSACCRFFGRRVKLIPVCFQIPSG
ncbi:hypothetical protein [Rhizobium alvei]|uniref:Uncharacterized protein n=1 Tax=Rhizobium alvei TaxID=1132659 RepID=A0ABT8YF18_9HYPH|nr:hypothetical protein [Rhizobium alvei]MDO6962315.1 hypothetical protein [Rhizobium alvei]